MGRGDPRPAHHSPNPAPAVPATVSRGWREARAPWIASWRPKRRPNSAARRKKSSARMSSRDATCVCPCQCDTAGALHTARERKLASQKPNSATPAWILREGDKTRSGASRIGGNCRMISPSPARGASGPRGMTPHLEEAASWKQRQNTHQLTRRSMSTAYAPPLPVIPLSKTPWASRHIPYALRITPAVDGAASSPLAFWLAPNTRVRWG